MTEYTRICIDCGKEYISHSKRSLRCEPCAKEYVRSYRRTKMEQYRQEQRRQHKPWRRVYAECVAINEAAHKAGTTYGKYTAPDVIVIVPEWARRGNR